MTAARFIELDGRRIETRHWGPPPGSVPTIVLLHEGLGSIDLWRDFPERLADATGCGIFAYSRFGYGRSSLSVLPRPIRYMHDEAHDILPRLLDAAGIGRAILLGHSDGASIATIYAGGVQDFRIRGVVLIAPHFFVEDDNLAAIAAVRGEWQTAGLRDKLARWHDNPDAAFHGWNDTWLDPRFRDFDLTSELAHIRVPILMLQGADDPYGSADQLRFAERETYCPCETVLIPGVKHAPHLEAPSQTVAAIAGFVSRIVDVHEPAQTDSQAAL